MKKQTVIFALAGIILGCVLLSSLPALGEQPYVPWTGLKRNLEQAGLNHPDNYAVPYYLGLAYLQEGDQNGAIDQWERYLSLAPEDFKSVSVRERLTILKLDRAAEEARQAVGMKALERKPVENSLAVFNFKNLAAQEFVAFTKALTMVIITDLSKIPDLVLLERIKVQALVTEMNLGATGIVDFETAAKAGGFLLARYITWGEVDTPGQDTIHIKAKVGKTLDLSNPVDVHAEGAKETFFELEKKIVFGIIEALGFTKENLSASVLKELGKYHTRNLNAFILFGKGLDYLDHKNFAESKAAFEQAAQQDPKFSLSKTMEKMVPQTALEVTAMEVMTEVEEAAETTADNIGEVAEVEEETPAKEQIAVPIEIPVKTMFETDVVETGIAAQEISDVAQEKTEVQIQAVDIVVEW